MGWLLVFARTSSRGLLPGSGAGAKQTGNYRLGEQAIAPTTAIKAIECVKMDVLQCRFRFVRVYYYSTNRLTTLGKAVVWDQ